MPKEHERGVDGDGGRWITTGWLVAGIVAMVMAAVVGCLVLTVNAAESRATAHVKVLVGAAHGSGVHIGDGYILTAAHITAVAPDKRAVIVRESSGDEVVAEVLWENVGHDLALMRVDDFAGMAAAPLSCKATTVGQPVWAQGNPISFEFLTLRGYVAGTPRGVGAWREAVPLDITAATGMSGGAVLNDAGEVAGIVAGIMDAGTPPMDENNVGIAIMAPSTAACALMGRAE